MPWGGPAAIIRGGRATHPPTLHRGGNPQQPPWLPGERNRPETGRRPEGAEWLNARSVLRRAKLEGASRRCLDQRVPDAAMAKHRMIEKSDGGNPLPEATVKQERALAGKRGPQMQGGRLERTGGPGLGPGG